MINLKRILLVTALVLAFTGVRSFAQTKTLSLQLLETPDRKEKIDFQLNNNGQDTAYYTISLQALINDEWKEADPDVLNNLPNKAVSVRAIAPGAKEPQSYAFSRLDAGTRNAAGRLRFKAQYGSNSDELDKTVYSETFK
ncbi:hypothetical protein [Deminuibacter soli]|uniref:Uncharacterized protein n=1 Tax=Deminuibacter soli TaxID=2291815 RepID=A0A3E1NII5_9BACT|nr:hypothetical protein [Deminuibacter soli]RFM27743.1 hypothetical protein DXN05_13660 [Deminuibacter soli]